MKSLKQTLKQRLAETEHLRTTYEALPRNAITAAHVISEWEREWVEKALTQRKFADRKNVSHGLLKLVQQKAMKDLSMKHHITLLDITLVNGDCAFELPIIEIIKQILIGYSIPSKDGYMITFEGYQSFLSLMTDYLMASRSTNCLWILDWFSVSLFVKLCNPQYGAQILVSQLLTYIEKKLDFYFYRVQQLETGIVPLLSKENIKITLAHININALEEFYDRLLSFRDPI